MDRSWCGFGRRRLRDTKCGITRETSVAANREAPALVILAGGA